MSVREFDPNAQPSYTVRVNVEISKVPNYGERLTFTEEFGFSAGDFSDIATVLGRFQKLAGEIRSGDVEPVE